jgi:acetolactate decarboxylase
MSTKNFSPSVRRGKAFLSTRDLRMFSHSKQCYRARIEKKAAQMTKKISTFCFLTLLTISCHAEAQSLFQLGNASALFSGAIEGNMRYSQLAVKGDFGLGTFNGINGEMVALDGKFYKIGQRGETTSVNPEWKTPFVELVKFHSNKSIRFENIDNYDVLKQHLASRLENKNLPYAIKIHGTFSFLKLRSRSPRSALQTQDIKEETYSIDNMKGTLVGFWMPDYLLTLTVPGFHFHFLSDDKKMSGHVLELKSEKIDAVTNQIEKIELVFPQTQVYKNANIIAATSDKYKSAQMNDKS